MTVCIDTNVVLGMFGRKGPWLPIRQALMDLRLIWAVTNEILLEYEEVAAREMGDAAAAQLLRFIELLEQTRGNIRQVSPTFRRRIPSPAHHPGRVRLQAFVTAPDRGIHSGLHSFINAKAAR